MSYEISRVRFHGITAVGMYRIHQHRRAKMQLVWLCTRHQYGPKIRENAKLPSVKVSSFKMRQI